MQQSNKTAFVWLGITIGVFTLSVIVYAWFFTEVDHVRSEAQNAVLRMSEQERGASMLSVNSALLKKNTREIETISSYFLHEGDIAPFAEKIEALGSIAGATLALDTLEQVKLPDGTKGLSLHVEASGSFESLVRLLKLFENFPARIEFNETSLTRESLVTKGAPGWVFEANIIMHNFITE